MARVKQASLDLTDHSPPPEIDDEFFVFPTTVAQRGFWFLDRLNPGNTAYNIAVRFRLRGPLHVRTLERAFNEILRRHETLRTGFREIDGEPMQAIAPSATMSVPVVDLRHVEAALKNAEADRHAEEEARRPFDIATPPLFRAVLLQLGDQDHMLLVTVHHIISDGWSIGIISDELGALYEAFSQDLESSLPDLAIQYADFAAWQEECLKAPTANLGEQLSFWKRQLADLTQLDIPTDRPRPVLQTHNGYIESVVLPREVTDALRQFSNRHGATMFMTSLAALMILLHRSSGQTDICVGSLVAGRHRVEIERLIGLFVNPIVLRTDLSGNPSVSTLLDRVKETVLGALANQDVPFQTLVEEVRPKRDPSRHPVFQVNFIYQRDFVRPLQFADLTLTAVPSKSPGAIYDLNFFMVERADGWRASCEYNTDLFDAATVQRMLRQFQALLEDLVADPVRPISSLLLLTSKERPRALVLPSSADLGGAWSVPREPGSAQGEPRDEIEERLVKICEKILGVGAIGIDSDFFELGGHSLMAARLLIQVERMFKKRVALAIFLQKPTVRHLATALRESGSTILPPQIALVNPNGAKIPFVAGAEFWPLARKLGPDQPVLTVTMEFPTPFRMDDYISGLVDKLLQVRPRGPYFVGGWCNAGLFAYEMAQHLRRRGHEVPLLVLFDSINARYAATHSPSSFRLMPQRVKHHWGELRGLGSKDKLDYMMGLGRSSGVAWERKAWRLLHRIRGEKKPAAALDTNRQAAREAEVALALDRHTFQPYTGPIVLFRTAAQAKRFSDAKFGWGDLARGGLTVHEVNSSYHDLFHGHTMDIVAESLRTHFAQASRP